MPAPKAEGIPRKLAVSPLSPNYNKEWLTRIDKVFVNGQHVPNCVAYDMDEGWAIEKRDGLWKPRVYGEVRVTVKQ